ncbi:HAD family hydrolase [Polymorphospora sp. NPDC050346]|uniref:HAD family hydrolase n=1 Tax=Polymorphospora sp. NPDC050346 TaxID=3155780 RepID=UPI0033FE1B1F
MDANGPAGVLFDLDGTLVDTTYLHTVAWWEALGRAGFDAPMARVHRGVGMGSDRLLDHVLGPERDRGADDRIRAGHREIFARHRERLCPLPGAADLLRACADRGLRVVLASSVSGDDLTALRSALAADDAVAAATCADDAPESRPSPDILVAALHKAGLAARRVVFVGDSVWDVAAARHLDIPCVALTCGGTCRAELAGAGAVAVYDDPAALLTALDESPIAALT